MGTSRKAGALPRRRAVLALALGGRITNRGDTADVRAELVAVEQSLTCQFVAACNVDEHQVSVIPNVEATLPLNAEPSG
jgi:hypothetical protein